MRTPYVHTPARNGDNAFLRRERDRRKRRELLLVVVALLPLGLGLLLYTWVQLETLRLGFRLSDLEAELHNLERQEQRLELTAAAAARLSTVEVRASEELGMARQSQEQTVYLEEIALGAHGP